MKEGNACHPYQRKPAKLSPTNAEQGRVDEQHANKTGNANKPITPKGKRKREYMMGF
jgi:hypothetical protein